MHVVGVPVGTGYKKGMSRQVSKRKVFTKDVLSIVLQDKLRTFANEKAKIVLGEQIREKSKGRNHDLLVMEYKVLKEEIRYDELKEQADEKQQENEQMLSGIRGEVTEIGWGNQIRSYVMQPYTMVKDHRTNEERGNVDQVMDGSIDPFINAYLKMLATNKKTGESQT